MFKVRTALLWLSFDVALSDATSLDAANWMASNLEWLGEKTLKELCIPGTHNSGMNKLFGGTAFAKPCNIVNQDRNIRRQLELGIRFFDIRPVLAKGGYRTGHYTKVFGGVWQGGYGHAIRTIVDNINAFTQTHSEVIFLRLSHTHNTDDGYRPFNQTEWNKLFDILDKTENLYHGPEDTYFPVLTLETLLDYGNKSAVIYIVDEPNNVVYLGSRVGKGFFYHYSLNLFDQYSSTNKIDFLYMDQLAKMKRMAKRRYFLLSWTLTQTGFDATMCPTMGKSTKDLALLAGKRLRSMLAQVTNYVYPNIINSDFVDSTELTEITMTINLKWLSLNQQESTTVNPPAANISTANSNTATSKSTTANPTTAKPPDANSSTAKPTTANVTISKPTTAKTTTAESSTAKTTTAESTTGDTTTAEATSAGQY